MSKTIRVGMAGMDHFFAALSALPALAQSPHARLEIVAHRDGGRAREVAQRFNAHATTDYQSVVASDDVDLVITACPTSENAALCVEAARRGKHILSVKPFAMNLTEADAILDAVRRAGVHFMSFDSNGRVSPRQQQFKTWIKEGRLGRPISAFCLLRSAMPEIAWMGAPLVRARTWWMDPSQVPGGGWIDHAIYEIDFLRWLLDDEVERISGETANLKHLDEPLEDFGVAVVKMKSGFVATVEVTWTAEFSGLVMSTHLVGTGGQVLEQSVMTGTLPTFKMDTRLQRIEYADPILGWQEVTPPAREGSLVTHMVDVIRGEASPVADGSDARANLAACLAFYQAAREGKPLSPASL